VLQLRQLLLHFGLDTTHSGAQQARSGGGITAGGGIFAGGAWDKAVQRLPLRCGISAATQAPAAAAVSSRLTQPPDAGLLELLRQVSLQHLLDCTG
jgi:hypothetical protein